jgi:hypothetical protein
MGLEGFLESKYFRKASFTTWFVLLDRVLFFCHQKSVITQIIEVAGKIFKPTLSNFRVM